MCMNICMHVCMYACMYVSDFFILYLRALSNYIYAVDTNKLAHSYLSFSIVWWLKQHGIAEEVEVDNGQKGPGR